MSKGLTRSQKIEALLAIKAGKKPAAVLPILEVLLVESAYQARFILIGGLNKDAILGKSEVDDYIQKFKAYYSDYYVDIFRMTQEKYETINAKFEAMY